MSLPSSVGLPQEMMLGHLDYSIPPDAKSFSVKVQPSNLSTITTTLSNLSVTNNSTVTQPDQPFPSQNLIFDLPCGASPSMFLDSRFTTLNFRATYTLTTAGTNYTTSAAYLRSNANSFFDRMYITSQNGAIVEDIGEYGLVNDTLIALQMNHAVRTGIANQYGFNANANIVSNGTAVAAGASIGSQDIGSQGHSISILSSVNGAVAAGQAESHSYSVPLVSGVCGVLADKFLNVGRTSKLQVVLQTSSVLPLTLQTTYGAGSVAPTITVTLDNFSLQCEYIDIGVNALQMLDQTLVDGKSYIHGTTYRTSSASLPSTAGTTSLLAGIRASSVKSLFARFVEGGTASATIANGKYDSKNPLLNSINFNVGGIKYPQAPINPLLFPSQAFRETQMAIGSFNNSSFQSCITPTNYCKLSAGGTAQSLTNGSNQEYSWSVGSNALNQAQFVFGENTEVCARRGLLSGLNCTSAPIFVEMNSSAAPTNNHTMYCIGMLDQIVIHDVRSGDIQVRI